MPPHKITLHNGRLAFSAWSTHSQLAVQNLARFERLLVLIHGFPDNNDSYHSVMPLLEHHYGSNVLVVAPLLRGYERLSQVDDREYRMVDIAQDVKAWITEIVPNGEIPVHLVGHDWGAIIAFKTASLYPELITSMVTLAIPYISNLKPWEMAWHAPQQLYLSSYFMTMQFKWLYSFKFGDLGVPGYLDQLWLYWLPDWDFRAEITSVRATLGEQGVLDAATAYYRNLFRAHNFAERKWLVDFNKVPTLILGGEKDGCMTLALFELESRVLAPLPHVKVQLLSGVGHFLHREDPTKVAELICDWFEKYK